MKMKSRIKHLVIAILIILICNNNIIAQSTEQPVVNVEEAKMIVSDIIKKFADYFEQGDSVALAAMYTKDATLGSAHGKEILAAIGGMIRSSIKNNSQHISYTSTSISVDGEFIVEVGYATAKDDKGNQKYKFKYLVVYKQEDGQWKLYKDMSL
ncbi:MAG TPA: nuclear transport factor 2 family protein [Chitinophagaceae bacterium]|nr:nuclear transport factor 2 family protein [Chitinophagaceae bacterium]MCB9056101.1 nuclear transport factor 2 family protein [Chitinophagales bacterium]HPG12064.1 nuclear transport factor 2 family protein [Chitinophagaceae bacterium]HRX93607.1 nuclear transport factor 2 family protein [Chitinophagaceae bacterium]